MKKIKKYISQSFEQKVKELKDEIKKSATALVVIEEIMKKNEGNIIRFNNDNTFRVLCIRNVNDEEQIVEEYDNMFTHEFFTLELKSSKCRDITAEFNVEDFFETIQCVDDLSNHQQNIYYFVTNETMYNYIRSCVKKDILELCKKHNVGSSNDDIVNEIVDNCVNEEDFDYSLSYLENVKKAITKYFTNVL